jgi:hypothetical protein
MTSQLLDACWHEAYSVHPTGTAVSKTETYLNCKIPTTSGMPAFPTGTAVCASGLATSGSAKCNAFYVACVVELF